MRLLTLFLALVCFSTISLAQITVVRAQAVPGCCGPYIPLVTTPMISLQSVSPNAVGARNATWGLVAGASNSTLSIVNGDTNSTYTQPVWYEGGTTPLISHPSVELGVPPMRMEMREHMEHMQRMEGEAHGHAAARAWTYYAPSEQTTSAVEAAASARTAKRATRSITNQDIDQENQKTGTVKYDGKTEQIK
jgi:hypothetical protein